MNWTGRYSALLNIIDWTDGRGRALEMDFNPPSPNHELAVYPRNGIGYNLPRNWIFT